jgi:hypothetical protein
VAGKEQWLDKRVLLIRAWRGFAALLLMVVLAGTAAAEPPPFQRMVIAPGCYVLAPGKSFDVDAYCLDEARQAPASGALLAKAPDALGDTVVKLGDGSVVGLKAALARYAVQIEGLGDFSRVRIKNLTGDRLEICINSPTVVMADDGTTTGDLSRIYDRIRRILAAQPATRQSDQDAHDAKQRALWQEAAEEAAKAERGEERARTGSSAAPRPRSPDPAKCVGRSDAVVVCSDQ